MNYFETLPDTPSNTEAPQILKRMIDGLGFRYQLATNGLSAEEAQFRPVESSMNIEEVNLHIFYLCRGTAKSLGALSDQKFKINDFLHTRQSILNLLALISEYLNALSAQDLIKKKIYLKRTDTNYSFWYLINGFIADAISHVGQINSWRRMAGNPVARISPFTGESY